MASTGTDATNRPIPSTIVRSTTSFTSAALDEPGWYVETVNPPIEWINPAAFGPYETLDALYDDCIGAYLTEDE